MSDAVDHDGLYRQAEAQAGYFTARQAIDVGMDRSTLRHHARPGGRYARIERGLYRFRHFPSSPHEHVVVAWLGLGDPQAAVSHESAMELHGLSDVIPGAVHLSLPRAKRGHRPRQGVRLHTLERPPKPSDIGRVHGLPVTTPERSLIDALEAGTQLKQIELGVQQALERGITTPRRLVAAAAGRSGRVRTFVNQTLSAIPA